MLISSVILCLALPVFEDPLELIEFQWSRQLVLLVLLSCFTWFAMTVSTVFGFAKTTPFNRAILAYMRTVCALLVHLQ